jgi:hypothetical protein
VVILAAQGWVAAAFAEVRAVVDSAAVVSPAVL